MRSCHRSWTPARCGRRTSPSRVGRRPFRCGGDGRGWRTARPTRGPIIYERCPRGYPPGDDHRPAPPLLDWDTERLPSGLPQGEKGKIGSTALLRAKKNRGREFFGRCEWPPPPIPKSSPAAHAPFGFSRRLGASRQLEYLPLRAARRPYRAGGRRAAGAVVVRISPIVHSSPSARPRDPSCTSRTRQQSENLESSCTHQIIRGLLGITRNIEASPSGQWFRIGQRKTIRVVPQILRIYPSNVTGSDATHPNVDLKSGVRASRLFSSLHCPISQQDLVE